MTIEKNEMTRRGFFQHAGLAAVTVSVPAWVWGCGGGAAATSEAANGTSSGGEATHTTGPGTVAPGTVAPATAGAGSAVSDEARAQVATFEGETLYTAAAPGQWEGKAASHVPQVTFQPGGVELFTDHGMSPEHWITAQYVKDQDGNLIAFTGHEGTDAEARASFTLPPGTTQITAYSHCNLHGDWSAEPAAPAA